MVGRSTDTGVCGRGIPAVHGQRSDLPFLFLLQGSRFANTVCA